MLREISKEDMALLHKDSDCRWFRDDYFDLFVWENEDGQIRSFQLCYDIYRDQKALNWNEGSGFSHFGVDDGENRPGKPKATQVFVADGVFNSKAVIEEFITRGKGMDRTVFDFVYKKLCDVNI